MKLLLARLVWELEWELADDGFELARQKVFIMREKPALNLRIRCRV